MAVGSSNDFDLVVLGAGTGGYSAAFRAAQLGLKVALVDRAKIGGTCLHIGCIPTKALLESAAFAERVRHAKDYGIEVGDPVLDYARMAERRDQVVKRLWTEETVDYQGKHVAFDGAYCDPKPIQRLPEIWVGGGGENRAG